MGACTGDPCAPNPCVGQNRTQCVAEQGMAVCQCDPGTHDEAGACVPDTACLPSTCHDHGACSDMTGTPVCACDPGYAGAFCEGCDAAGGYVPDLMGGCTNTPCLPNPCPLGKSDCQVENGMIVCHCDPGTHDENGACVPDVTCTDTTCSGHGTCSLPPGGMPTCACETGFATPYCADCDVAAGYHDDGMGGCTNDPCMPNPCNAPNQTVCVNSAGTAVCECVPGHHLEGPICVFDQVCEPMSCSGHGTCDATGGVVVCSCDPGYSGASCADCDVAGGYHGDGMGGCTSDPCLPNPCNEPHETVCTANGTLATCSCEAGYHPDGVGGCTDDPCVPNPCAAQNQACQNQNGQAQCYTPVCDDQNPCTADAVVGGACQHAPLADGAACSTGICTTGQVCLGATCTGGVAIDCADQNPCTVDSCDALAGCKHVVDASIVPDDGVACTVDSCAGGAPAHTKTDAICDDGKYCSGVEVCSPASPGADGKGCVVTNVPAPPGASGPCFSYGACDEPTKSFPLLQKPAGSSCNDGIGCTQNDVCNAAGACAGSPTPACASGAACAGSTPYPGTIDIPVSQITGTITMGGAPLPATNTYGVSTNVYLKSKDTGAWHELAYFNYSGAGNTLFGPTWTTKVVPGLYDVLYEREYISSGNYVYDTDATDKIPHGLRILQSDVVIGAGPNTLNIDIPVAQITGTITMGGQPLPATNTYGVSTNVYLKSKDTGAWHELAYFNYSGAGNTLFGPTWTTKVVPGLYDVLYEREYISSGNYVYDTESTDAIPHGLRILQSNVTINAGPNTLNIDIPVAQITGTITMGGQPLPATNTYGVSTNVYLKSKDTGAWHELAYFNYSGAGNTLFGPTWTTKVVPGLYDVLYEREYISSGNYVYDTESTDAIPHGLRILQSDVMINAGPNTLNVDIPVAQITGTITMGGQPLPTTNTYGVSTNVYLVSKDTGAWHELAYFNYSGAGNTLFGPTWTTKVVPGLYDVLYEREYISNGNYVYDTDATDKIPHGLRILQSNVTINAGPNTLNIDIPVAQITGTITLGGQPLPATNTYGVSTNVYLKSKDTGAWHELAYFNYSGAGNTLFGPTWTTKVVPGLYDVLYEREYISSGNYVYDTDATDKIPHGLRILQSNLLIAAGSNTLNIDIPVSPLSGAITMSGLALPATNTYGVSTNLYLLSRDTGAWHELAYFNYSGAGNSLFGPTWTTKVVPGLYDILYEREYISSGNYVYDTDATDKIPHGLRLLGVCVNVP